ncbi:hypothetical protein Daus18300_004204 [Diaporthe australafricana]|uniref:Heterokaryon incompatibility domain-containing protein n=1 Tax=Diaporthe australafricana TaxID=127596 RepID=A0ABR3X9L1_9PEZI
MWLIHVGTKQLEEFIGLDVPQYAILSHTWVSGQEVTFQEIRSPGSPDLTSPSKGGWQKIDMTCRQAAIDGLNYAWVDTCCIDKSSSAELSEAINSMFRWYKRATAEIEHCRWFTRSWTLQELLAPLHVEFFNRDWEHCFTKAIASEALAQITGIDIDVLNHETDLTAVCVAQKMSWAATRQSTRIEDLAYSLLGIFGINMPLLYGEEERAFLRLQTEVISSCPDPTILAWMLRRCPEEISEDPGDSYSGVMASFPANFWGCAEVTIMSDQSLFDFSMSNRGIKLRAQFGLIPLRKLNTSCLVLPVCQIRDKAYGIRLRNIGGDCFVRQNAYRLVRIDPRELAHRLVYEPFLLTQLSPRSTAAVQAQNFILKSRQCVLEVVLPPDMEVYRRWPWQKWDEQDAVFFGQKRPSEDVGWASLKVIAWPPPPFDNHDAPKSIDVLFYAFGWATHPGSGPPPRCTLHRVRGSVEDRAMEQMNHEAVRDCWNAYWVANRLFMNGVREQHFLVAGTTERRAMLLVCDISRAEDAEKCLHPFWRAEFSWRVVPRDQVPMVPRRSWTKINWGPIWEPPWDALED